MNANWWANNKYGSPLGDFEQNQFGGNFAGPIWRRAHLYFFGGYEGLRQPSTATSGPLTVPSDLERSGDFSQSLNFSGKPTTIFNPFSTTAVQDSTGTIIGYTRQAFPGNKIPASLIDKVGQNIANLHPH